MNEPTPMILIVEDEADLRASLVDALGGDYLLLEAADGEQGFALATEHVPDLILTDVMMPGMDGFTLCRMLKRHEDTSHIPVIIMTILAGQENELRGLEEGADDYIPKPFSLPILRARAHNLIESRRRLRLRLREIGSSPAETTAAMPKEERFIRKVLEIADSRLADPSFCVLELASELQVSERTLQSRLKSGQGLSPNIFIRNLRMKRAWHLLSRGDMSVTEVAVAVGIPDLSYFGKCFRREFGVPPSEIGPG